jgi:hypothetical protein
MLLTLSGSEGGQPTMAVIRQLTVLSALSQKVSQMPRHDETGPGSLNGLRLPPNAWYVLRRENIRTITQLRAIAGRIERFEGITPRPCCRKPRLHPQAKLLIQEAIA